MYLIIHLLDTHGLANDIFLLTLIVGNSVFNIVFYIWHIITITNYIYLLGPDGADGGHGAHVLFTADSRVRWLYCSWFLGS